MRPADTDFASPAAAEREEQASIIGRLMEVDFDHADGTLITFCVPHGSRWGAGEYLIERLQDRS